ncbi:MAG TPA: O-antigen ligase family protein [Cyclobacteriaceae bacterium]|nr:O-antigen ligase family protein [Cyclobacteriaceae bacterium]
MTNLISRLTQYNYAVERILLASLVISIPLKVGISSVVVGIIALYWLIGRKFNITLEVLKESVVLKLILAYLLVIIASAVTSSDVKEGMRLLEKRLNLLAIPLTLASFSITSKDKALLLKAFIGVCLCCAVYSIISTYVVHDFNFQRLLKDREYLSYYCWIIHETLGLNASYYALFVAFASILAAYYALYGEKKYRIYYLGSYLFLFAFMALLGSRISLLAMLALSLALLGKAWRDRKIAITRVLAILSAVVVASILFMKIPYLSSRVMAAINSFGDDPRSMTFDCAIEVIKEKPIFGHGLGDVTKAALSCYLNKGYTEPYQDQYNFHNEFLEITASAGIIGLLVFLMLLGTLLWKGLREQNIIGVAFIFLFMIACQPESLLDRNKGILFFAFFSTLLFLIDVEKKDSSR